MGSFLVNKACFGANLRFTDQGTLEQVSTCRQLSCHKWSAKLLVLLQTLLFSYHAVTFDNIQSYLKMLGL